MAHEAVLLGAGERGRHVYGAYAKRRPDRLRFTAVADPDGQRRDLFGREHGIPSSMRFRDWPELLEAERAPVLFIASPDRCHAEQAVAALERGLHVLLEKPAAHTLEESARVLAAARRSRGRLTVCHVLRHTPFFSALNGLLASGRLGEPVSIEHREDTAYWYSAHSFVRGNWAKAAAATPRIVQMCCHDFDLLAWNLEAAAGGVRVTRMQSFGSLLEFRPERAPEGASDRCTDPCPAAPACPYDARRLYLGPARTGLPVHTISDDLSPEGRLRALREGPYGRCVYTAGSDVVDHQTVSMELSSGATAVLVMNGHAARQTRTALYHGTRGSVRAVFGGSPTIEFTDRSGGGPVRIPVEAAAGGHGGGDEGLIEDFLDSLEGAETAEDSAEVWFESHLLAFSAEEARLSGGVLDIDRRRTGYL